MSFQFNSSTLLVCVSKPEIEFVLVRNNNKTRTIHIYNLVSLHERALYDYNLVYKTRQHQHAVFPIDIYTW